MTRSKHLQGVPSSSADSDKDTDIITRDKPNDNGQLPSVRTCAGDIVCTLRLLPAYNDAVAAIITPTIRWQT